MWRVLVIGALVSGLAAAEAAEAISQAELATSVYRIFERSCAQCHDRGRAKKPKAFGVILDLDALSANDDYVVSGKPDDSEIVLCLTGDGWADQMPPADSDAPPVSTEEQVLIRAWVAGGAGSAGLSAEEMAASSHAHAEPQSAAQAKPFSLYRLVGKVHPVMVHFPVALLLVAFLAEIGVLLGWTWLAPVVRVNTWIAALGGIAAVVTGLVAQGVQGHSDDSVWLHKWLGISTTALALIALISVEFAERKCCSIARLGLRLALLAGALLVSAAGYSGGELVYGIGHLW
jgi:uncharacterized membrane protein/mono/diheme cytochrome c family protein